ncbi:hypothetical protein [Rhizobium sp. 2MFCol3.1]|uniref:hypothetical protein n=1 Tax=unclassified Rhizobium TaxID=2613769 RepID=UPI000DDF151E|nr:hypothetical protein [Rhizobium sp. 2MFCol3.1]
MTYRYLDWLEKAQVARSYRAMFALATAIVSDNTAPKELRRGARRVVKTLEPVIDLPIASAAVLKKAHHFFSLLSVCLVNEVTKAGLQSSEGPARVEPEKEVPFTPIDLKDVLAKLAGLDNEAVGAGILSATAS